MQYVGRGCGAKEVKGKEGSARGNTGRSVIRLRDEVNFEGLFIR